MSRWMPTAFMVGLLIGVIRAGDDDAKLYRSLAIGAALALLGIWNELSAARYERKRDQS